MATKYADRAFIAINGARISDVQSASLRQNRASKAVPSMTNDGFNRGFVQGNREIDLDVTIAVQNKLAFPKLGDIDYEANDVQLTFIVGSDQFTATGLFPKEDDITAGGVGEEVKVSFKFGALKVIDSFGNSVLFNIGL